MSLARGAPPAEPALPPLAGAVLIGGRSTRMGRPKHLLPWQGHPLVEHVVRAIEPVVERLVLVGAGELPPGLGLPRLDDAPAVHGPLAGILAALRAAPDSAWVVAACDLPQLTTEALRWLLAQRAPDRVAVLPSLDGVQVEPLLAIYEPAARRALEALVAAGQRAPRLLREHPGCLVVTVPAALAAAWRNVNAPDELAALS